MLLPERLMILYGCKEELCHHKRLVCVPPSFNLLPSPSSVNEPWIRLLYWPLRHPTRERNWWSSRRLLSLPIHAEQPSARLLDHALPMGASCIAAIGKAQLMFPVPPLKSLPTLQHRTISISLLALLSVMVVPSIVSSFSLIPMASISA